MAIGKVHGGLVTYPHFNLSVYFMYYARYSLAGSLENHKADTLW
jgi:hypothetical protein